MLLLGVLWGFFSPICYDISRRDHIILQHYVLFQHAVPCHVSAADGDAAHYALRIFRRVRSYLPHAVYVVHVEAWLRTQDYFSQQKVHTKM